MTHSNYYGRPIRRRSVMATRISVLLMIVLSLFSTTGLSPTALSDEREAITYEHVYGSKRISSGRGSRVRRTWIDDSAFIVRDREGWQLIDAESGDASPFFDREVLKAALSEIEGITQDDATRLASGSWKHLDKESRRAVFELRDTVIAIGLDGTAPSVINDLPTKRELLTVSPDGNAVAFVRNNELYAADFETGMTRQLTFDASETVRNGKADWVYFEELFDRSWHAFRFSPDGQSIAYMQFNDEHVPTFSVIDHSAVDQVIETEHWPQAGDTNPLVRLGIVPTAGGDTTWVDTSEYAEDDFLISHFNWFPDGSELYWYAQNRIQTWLDINRADPATGGSRQILRDSNEAWIESPGDLTFLSDGTFLVRSDRNGWMHLYRVSPDDGSMTPLTKGDWEVRAFHGVDAQESFALVSGTRDSHIAENLYRVSLTAASDPVRLTPDDGHHICQVSPGAQLFIDRWSTVHRPEASALRDAQGKQIRTLSEPAETDADRYRFGKVTLEELPMADGVSTTGIVVWPPDFDEQKKHPVWLMTYGGPHRPNVRNSWRSRLLEHLLANLGVVVIRFDPRTASGYGSQSAWEAYRQLGVEEARDVEALCQWLSQQSWADASRIGMNGHSYGGYYTAYTMTHSDVLCAGIAGAPVTDWAHYDSIYTERFMSTPQDNPDGYRKSSVVAAAADLKGRLLILHGLKDDNVHPANTIQLIHRLQRADRDFEVMFYPTARHGIFGSHYNRLMYNFIVESLQLNDATSTTEVAAGSAGGD